MGPVADDLTGASLLAVFAHPDDESIASGGLLARAAAAGARVSLLCLTRGEQGPGAGGGDVAAVRTKELHQAARLLGVHEVILLDHEDGMLSWIEPHCLEADVALAIRRLRPDVVVTFDEDGLYGHPDHVAVHERVTAAVASLGPAAPALWYVSTPAGAVRALAEAAGAPGSSPEILGVDADAFGAMAPPPTLVLEAGRFAELKVAALRCHRSQVEGGPLALVGDRVASDFLDTEHYRRAPVGAPGDTLMERLGTPAEARP